MVGPSSSGWRRALLVLALSQAALAPPPPSLPPPPLSLKVIFPPVGAIISGASLAVSIDLLLEDASYSTADFMSDHFGTTNLCVRMQLLSAGDCCYTGPDKSVLLADPAPTYDDLQCTTLDTAQIEFVDLPFGKYSISAYLDSPTLPPRYGNLDGHVFDVTQRKPSSPTITDEVSLRLLRQQRSLLQWYNETWEVSTPPPTQSRAATTPLSCFHRDESTTSGHPSHPPTAPLFLILGIKSSVDSFEHRQALRETWLSSTLPLSFPPVCYYFIIGVVDPAKPQYSMLNSALLLEQSYYNDLLLAPLFPVLDSYYTLVEKTTGFMRHAVKSHRSFSYLMMLDDDVYLSLSSLIDALNVSAPRIRFYAGQVWSIQYERPLRPQRNVKNRNYLSLQEYPKDILPPFAIGPHYVLSRDVAEYIASNTPRPLVGVGTLEDVSVGFWLQQQEVGVEHVPQFQNARNEKCGEDIVSFADLRPHAIRRVHDNVRRGVELYCEGFAEDWVRNGASLTGFSDSFYDNFERGPREAAAITPPPPPPPHLPPLPPPPLPPLLPLLTLLSPAPVSAFYGKSALFSLSSPSSPSLLSDLTVCLRGNDGTLKFATRVLPDGRIEADFELCLHYDGPFEFQIPYLGSHDIKLEARRTSDGTKIADFDLLVQFLPELLPPTVANLDALLLDSDAEADRDQRLVAQAMSAASMQKRRRVRLAILFMSFDYHSQNGMFLRLARHLPRKLFRVEAVGFSDAATSSSTSDTNTVTSELTKAFVPSTAIPAPPSDSYSYILLSELQQLSSLADMSPSSASYLSPLISALSHVDAILLANAHEDPRQLLTLELCRLVSLSREHPIVRVMDLPNLDVHHSVFVDAFVAPSHFVKHYPDAQWRAPVKVVYPPALSYNPARLSAAGGFGAGEPPASTCKSRSIGDEDIVIGYLGRLAPERFPGLFLLMVWHLLNNHAHDIDTTRLRFVVAGDGPSKNGLRLMAAHLNISDRVDFVGNLEPRQVGEFLSSLSVYVNSKFVETFGISNVEAGFSGVPIVGFKSAGNLESIFVGDGRHVLVSPDQYFEGLARGVIDVLRSGSGGSCDTTTTTSGERQHASQQHYERFSLRRFVNGYASLFLDLTENARGSGGGVERAEIAMQHALPLQSAVSTISVGYSPAASYFAKTMSLIFTKVFSGFNVVISRLETDEHQPHVLVLSVLDSPRECEDARSFMHCEPWIVHYRKMFPSSKIVLVSGEPWDIHNADLLGADIVLAGHTNPRHFPTSIPVIYFPNAATSFGERLLNSYGDLEEERRREQLRELQPGFKQRKFCAYMYSRCDRPEREAFFDALRKKAAASGLEVDALGACGGTSVVLGQDEKRNRVKKRFTDFWHDDAVQIYKEYAFVVAFENVQEDGYFTEKILNPFLSGSIPIYWGWSGVGAIFNEDAFVDCNRFGADVNNACADHVIALYTSGNWKRMLDSNVVVNKHVLEEEFGWADGKGRVVRELVDAMWEIGEAQILDRQKTHTE